MIENIMTKKIVMANIKDTIRDVSLKMRVYDIGFLPVVKETKLVGVITDRDIATALKDMRTLSTKIEAYMTKNIIAIDMKKSIKDALKLMKKEHVKRLLVKHNHKLVGILSFSDILAHYIDGESILDTMKSIFTIQKNTDHYEPEIDEFYL